ncbi:MAG: tetratricopeptide repeat protein, partial [Dehalococcoidia bacterium]
ADRILQAPSATPVVVLMARSGLAMLAVIEGNAEQAGQLYTALDPWHGTIPTRLMTVDRILGLLAHTMGNLEQAVADFEESLAFCRKIGARPELAWTCCDYADTLLRRNNPGDRERAMSLLDESLAISTELGMRPLMERVLSRRDVLKA